MPDYNIPESVIPGNLFVPSANDYFSIDAGGLPNGDDCLLISGATSSDYKAYQTALLDGQHTGPAGAFSNANGTEVDSAGYYYPNHFVSPYPGEKTNSEFSISMWLKIPTVTGAGAYYDSRKILMGVMNSWASNPCTTAGLISNIPSWYGATAAPMLIDVNWVICMYGNNQIGFIKQCAWRNATGTGGRSAHVASATIPVDTWFQLVFNVGSIVGTVASSSYAYINDDPVGTNNVSNGTYASIVYPCDTRFSIGSYADGSNMNGLDVNWRIGKLAFHDHHLTLEERTLMYDAMVG